MADLTKVLAELISDNKKAYVELSGGMFLAYTPPVAGVFRLVISRVNHYPSETEARVVVEHLEAAFELVGARMQDVLKRSFWQKVGRREFGCWAITWVLGKVPAVSLFDQTAEGSASNQYDGGL